VLANVGTVPNWPLPTKGDWLIQNLEILKPQILEASKTAKRIPLKDVDFLSPVANPTKVIAAPVNYLAHQSEVNQDKTVNFGTQVKTIETVGLFLKANSSLVGVSEGVRLREDDRRHDHEGELVVIIGKVGYDIPEADALDYVAAYSVGLDMTARGPEERSLRKSCDTYSVVGPWLTTPDEVSDPDNLELHLTVNGETRQKTNTNLMIYKTRKLISYASSFYTLYPGDVLFTGTPDGVSRVYAGDEMYVEIESVGEMTVKVVK
ncbi:fumarylacetoacetate hydrolase family protein, partial [Pseudomonas sp. CrR25]|nr:fumarylacetoacetate hydrolase family protein [Pseudomonas sp. CrR25]